jgi:hypothetical protein
MGAQEEGGDEEHDTSSAERQYHASRPRSRTAEDLVSLIHLSKEATDRGRVAALLLQDRVNGCANVTTGTGGGLSTSAIAAMLGWAYVRAEEGIRQMRLYMRALVRETADEV